MSGFPPCGVAILALGMLLCSVSVAMIVVANDCLHGNPQGYRICGSRSHDIGLMVGFCFALVGSFGMCCCGKRVGDWELDND